MDLQENLLHLIKEIDDHQLHSSVAIIVSDNCSPDTTEPQVREIIKSHPKVQIMYFRQKENIGLEKNAVFVFQQATAGHVMYIGDDDLIDKGYLNYCVQQIKQNENLGCILSGLQSVNKRGDIQPGRMESYGSMALEKGYNSLLHYSHFAHQMSGLVVKNNDVLATYLREPSYRNPYLFIFFAAYQLYEHGGIYAPVYKTSVQVENEKDWGYNEIGLLDKVFKSFLYFEGLLSEPQMSDLLVHFVRMHSYRLTIKKNRPLLILRQAKKLSELVASNTLFKRSVYILLIKEYLCLFVKRK